MRKAGREQIDGKVRAALAQVGLEGYEARFQRQMSGGEQQRVALARVLVTEPHILLLDEPLSALDKKLREEMKYWIKDLQHQLGITTIYVTHDQSEALTMSNRIAVMQAGQIQQVGSPTEIYEHPVNRFVTDFIGESNIVQVAIIEVEQPMMRLRLDAFELTAPWRSGVAPGRAAALAVRPEHILLGTEAQRPGVNRLTGRIREETYQGPLIRYALDVGDHRLVAETQNRPGRQVFAIGSEIDLGWEAGSGSVLLD
jgi:ABC-type Fe3+/spermidine/putrescine transport system ATPase subunit